MWMSFFVKMEKMIPKKKNKQKNSKKEKKN